ncbi:hypothetical protein MaudCBS49596_004267 [Microsporum audouinii]
MSTPPSSHVQPHKPAVHKPHRPHVVGGQRAHGRNTSQMNLNKLQRLAMAHNITSDLHGGQEAPATGRRQHMRKKSAPSSPATSPKTGHHVRWNGSAVALGGVSSNNPSMKKNHSTPVLKREGSSGNVVKKGHLLGELSRVEKPEEKKSIGFELADSDEDDEWEDHSSPSTASTRRNSLVGGKAGNNDGNPQNTTLTFTKSPLVQQNNAADMKPEPREGPAQAEAQTSSTTSNEDSAQPTEQQQNDVTQRLLCRQHSGMVPPAISSVSATATQAPPERSSRVSSFANLSSLGGINQPDSRHNNEREEPHRFSPNATPSSTEVGVSRFLITHQNGSSHPGGRSESDFSTPSSFLPNYQPRTPPSPEAAVSKALKSPNSRRRPPEPHSRTQQKLWLQRTATLSTSPSETSIGPMAPVVAPQINDSNVTHARLVHDPHRTATASGGFAGGPSTEGESKRIKKAYERLASEFSVMHRFRNPVVDSLNRMYDMTKPPAGQDGTSQPNASSNSGPVNANETNHGTSHTRNGSHTSHANPSKPGKQGSVRFKDHDDPCNDDSDDLNDQNNDDRISRAGYQLTEEELLVRRMWNSLEVAAPGD